MLNAELWALGLARRPSILKGAPLLWQAGELLPSAKASLTSSACYLLQLGRDVPVC